MSVLEVKNVDIGLDVMKTKLLDTKRNIIYIRYTRFLTTYEHRTLLNGLECMMVWYLEADPSITDGGIVLWVFHDSTVQHCIR